MKDREFIKYPLGTENDLRGVYDDSPIQGSFRK